MTEHKTMQYYHRFVNICKENNWCIRYTLPGDNGDITIEFDKVEQLRKDEHSESDADEDYRVLNFRIYMEEITNTIMTNSWYFQMRHDEDPFNDENEMIQYFIDINRYGYRDNIDERVVITQNDEENEEENDNEEDQIESIYNDLFICRLEINNISYGVDEDYDIYKLPTSEYIGNWMEPYEWIESFNEPITVDGTKYIVNDNLEVYRLPEREHVGNWRDETWQ